MKLQIKEWLAIYLIIASTFSCSHPSSIDREALVNRHQVINTSPDTLNSLTIGNGGFAFTADITGLQSFPESYKKGIPLGTQSDWGWHSFPNSGGYSLKETMKGYKTGNKEVSYSVQDKSSAVKMAAADYFRINPHRLHLGLLGFVIHKEDGSTIQISEISNINQVLDLWKGEIRTVFEVMNTPVKVITVCHPSLDAISVKVESELISKSKLSIGLRFPYPSGAHADMACRWDVREKHSSKIEMTGSNSALIERKLDSTCYYTGIQWSDKVQIKETELHNFQISSISDKLELTVLFSPTRPKEKLPGFTDVRSLATRSWEDFWLNGGAVDLTGSTDPRANELERRIILSQYLTRVQCAGDHPPQETGLTYNSWYGKFHLEMAWWHMTHFFLWNRTDLIEESLEWYKKTMHNAKETAIRQGYEGIRWQKMTDPAGNDSPSSVGSFLIWQQPHIIYFAELYYRQFPNESTLNRFKNLVSQTADFMASYANYDSINDRYILGPPLIPAQECFNPVETINPPFELSYWYWGLKTAVKWAKRTEQIPNPEWEFTLNKLSGLFSKDSLYTPAESVPYAYSEKNHMHDHPAVLGAYGIMPDNPLTDTSIMRKTFAYIWKNWEWERTWGWDFPMTAMTAVRLGKPEKAIDALFMDPVTNTYLKNGHNYQTPRLRLYLPGNGGLLTAVAMMCAGYDGCKTINPGFPDNGKWKVRWEGLSPMP